MKIKPTTLHFKILSKNMLVLSFALIFLPSFLGLNKLAAQESLKVLISAPKVLTSDATGGTLITETFEGFTALPNNNWAPLPNGYNSTIGTYKQTTGVSYVKADDQYGTGSPQYMSIKVGGKVSLKFDEPQTYFGFAWPAGDGKNTIKIIRQGQVIGTFTTSDVINLIPNTNNHKITAINGTQYFTKNYYGKPGTGQNTNEPYGFLHFMATPGMAFDAVELSMGAGGEFENDNHTIMINGTPTPNGSWVDLITVNTPNAIDDADSGMPGQSVTLDVLANDMPGDAALDATTVQIAGTASPGASLTVAGEGVWSVNPTNGKITFTPEAGFLGNPTPIQYSVKDVNHFVSNLATVTVTYPTGPTAVDDFATTDVDVAVTIDVLSNDIAGSTPIAITSLSFVNGTEPNAATVGVFTLNATTGEVTFTPATGYVGIATIDYKVCDANNLCDIATIEVTIVAGTINYYPALGPGTLAFEDLWPYKGDYDFNDLVLDYQFEIITTTTNHVEKVIATMTIKAFGASFENGFGFQLSDAIDASKLSVSGYSLTESYITLNGNGTEAGQSKPTIIVYDNSYSQMEHPGMGIGVNTEPAAPYVQPKTFTITIDFQANTYTLNQLDIANFNPFLIVNKDRAVEVHLPYYPPTDLANTNLLASGDDDSDAGSGKYYVTAANLPWAINIYETFDYPIEKQDIVRVHLKFAEWASSGGILFPNWYQNLSGFRNNALIYTAP
ncbi:MAG: LruC domain-containing protein [Bacteroidales bacterium]|nr:LruC domain-containing protein [Bacteroidales bacterium]